MFYIFAICILIIIIVLLLSVLTTSKAYKYEHKIDPLHNDDQTPEIESKQNNRENV
ncbi:YtzI protein [Metabacillus idriensis]|uniref:YtzI protein n=1 Tax=Metabacillus idriensis TaxID=324768 RepID=A0A6I2MBX3_9BACI|nr:YtzI protein [Metabacillus idriensis]MCM3596667.1 YtzI protein [Metabacillus idriensis]MRX55249.1 YtzI protein [Metabacillus idriensis]